MDHVQWDSAFGVAVNFQLEIILPWAFEVETEMLPDVNVCLRSLTRNPNFKILTYGFKDWPHVGVAEVHFEPVTALFANIKSQLTGDCT